MVGRWEQWSERAHDLISDIGVGRSVFFRNKSCLGLLKKSTCLFKAFSDQIKAPKAPKMRINTGFTVNKSQ